MLEQTVEKVLATKAYAGDATFEALIPHEIAAKGLAKVRKDKTSATIGCLWMKRALNFITTFLKLLITTDKPSTEVAYQTYETVLKPYHGWLASKVHAVVLKSLCGDCPRALLPRSLLATARLTHPPPLSLSPHPTQGVGMTMSFVPAKAAIFTSLGFADAAEAADKLGALVAVIEPALGDLQTMLDAQGADFPDKV